MTETVFEVGGEGGAISIVRKINAQTERFLIHVNELDLISDELGDRKENEFASFQAALQHLSVRYPWYRLQLLTLHPAFRAQVLETLITYLNQFDVQPEELKHTREQLEELLCVRLEFGNAPSKSGLQHITIDLRIGTTTEYEYANHAGEYFSDSVRHDDLKVWKKVERLDYRTITCEGFVEFAGSTVIIKDFQHQPLYIFHSENAVVTLMPVWDKAFTWFYTNL